MSAISRESNAWYSAELRNGDCMTQPEFHEAYERMPEGFRAELIDGTVYVCEPLGRSHGSHDNMLSTVMGVYRAASPGIEACNNASVILGMDDEVQPDVLLRILPNFNGQSQHTSGEPSYIKGAPELVAEIAYSSRSSDLHFKKRRYEVAGVIEYIVVCLDPLQMLWFDLRNQKSIAADDDGVFRSIVFPGLWINGPRLLNSEHSVLDDLNRGLASPEHASFVKQLQSFTG
jgi:Uma2 family endonuclease